MRMRIVCYVVNIDKSTGYIGNYASYNLISKIKYFFRFFFLSFEFPNENSRVYLHFFFLHYSDVRDAKSKFL